MKPNSRKQRCTALQLNVLLLQIGFEPATLLKIYTLQKNAQVFCYRSSHFAEG